MCKAIPPCLILRPLKSQGFLLAVQLEMCRCEMLNFLNEQVHLENPAVKVFRTKLRPSLSIHTCSGSLTQWLGMHDIPTRLYLYFKYLKNIISFLHVNFLQFCMLCVSNSPKSYKTQFSSALSVWGFTVASLLYLWCSWQYLDTRKGPSGALRIVSPGPLIFLHKTEALEIEEIEFVKHLWAI